MLPNTPDTEGLVGEKVRLSVVIVTRNDATRLATTLESLRCVGSVEAVEVVVVDGASTDDTHQVVNRFSPMLPRLSFYSEEDRGIYDAMNRGYARAVGQFVYFLNCGDTLGGPRALRQVLLALQDGERALWAIARVRHHYGGSARERVTETIPFGLGRLILGRQDYNHQACVFRQDALLALGGFNLNYQFLSDYDLILRFALLHSPLEIDVVLADYEGGGVSAGRAMDIPLLMHTVRSDRFRLGGAPEALSLAYAWLQTVRRFGLRAGLRKRAELKRLTEKGPSPGA
jgi:glycosyltransferase involved in cell wall biosynthesis